MLKDFRVRHCNCLEHVLCNIILNEYIDEGLLFINSWKFRYFEHSSCLRDKFSIYLADYSDLYDTAFEFYGIKICDTIDIKQVDKEELKKYFKRNKYMALKIKACECPWLSFLHEIHGEHMILVMESDDTGVFCSDNSAEKYFLSYEFVITYVKQLIVFGVELRVHNLYDLRSKILDTISMKINIEGEYNGIKLFADEFDSYSVDKELSVCELITSPLIKRLSLVGFSRVNYCKAIRYVYKDEYFKFERPFAEMEIISTKWSLVNKQLAKYGVSNNTKYLMKIKPIICDIAEAEYIVANELLGLIQE